jgi:hypothetical protein
MSALDVAETVQHVRPGNVKSRDRRLVREAEVQERARLRVQEQARAKGPTPARSASARKPDWRAGLDDDAVARVEQFQAELAEQYADETQPVESLLWEMGIDPDEQLAESWGSGDDEGDDE